jgi:hypothetical protein
MAFDATDRSCTATVDKTLIIATTTVPNVCRFLLTIRTAINELYYRYMSSFMARLDVCIEVRYWAFG